jgi:tRNA modification GTPase
LLDDARQSGALVSALSELRAARAELAKPAWEDRAAERLRRALSRLGEAAGRGTPDDVLDSIFSRFCVGK